MTNKTEILAPENKQLSERENLFLEVLFGEAKGDFKEAKKLAGYPSSVPDSTIARRLSEEIVEGTRLFLALNAPKAVSELLEILVSARPIINAKDKLIAAKEILDRAGVVRKEEKKITYSGGVMLLPPKDA